MSTAFTRALREAAAAPYLSAGYFAWYFARGKLGGDPAFLALLERGLIPDNARILDLGCGQGLLASWLFSARALFEAGHWPAQWPPAPKPMAYQGIELMPREVQWARRALGERAEFFRGDMRTADFGRSDAIVILDALHFIDYCAQGEVLSRARDALVSGGGIVMRVGDADGGLPFRISNWVDHLVAFTRGHRLSRLYCRSLQDWQALLRRLGFTVQSVPMSQGTPFTNVLLVARLGRAAAHGGIFQPAATKSSVRYTGRFGSSAESVGGPAVGGYVLDKTGKRQNLAAMRGWAPPGLSGEAPGGSMTPARIRYPEPISRPAPLGRPCSQAARRSCQGDHPQILRKSRIYSEYLGAKSTR